jgi:flagellar protein FlaF
MIPLSYDTATEDSAQEARAREAGALSHGIARLQRLQGGDLRTGEAIDTLLFIRRLWAFFIEDLASPENGLPQEVRAQLISIGIWIVKEVDRLRAGETEDVSQLILINSVIRDSLQ